MSTINYNRRRFVKNSVIVGTAALPWLGSCTKTYEVAGLNSTADENGFLLPPGSQSRILAYAGKQVRNSNYIWHSAPDGGAVQISTKGGWRYISNSEVDNKQGGVGVIEFDNQGSIISAHPILKNTSRNCGGCLTPWHTWLSCEEISRGVTWECDPTGKKSAIARPNLGVFKHESIAIDSLTHILYLTEDEPDGCFYRFTPIKKGDLTEGKLEVAAVGANGDVQWKNIADPLAKSKPTRRQNTNCSRFVGGEDIVYDKGKVYFDTKGDNRIWVYDTSTNRISVFYDAMDYKNPILTGVDTMAMYNDTLLVCEDGGNMQIVAISPEKEVKPVLQLLGHDNSEISGIAFSPDKSRLYLSSQRGKTGKSQDAITYEITGKLL